LHSIDEKAELQKAHKLCESAETHNLLKQKGYTKLL